MEGQGRRVNAVGSSADGHKFLGSRRNERFGQTQSFAFRFQVFAKRDGRPQSRKIASLPVLPAVVGVKRVFKLDKTIELPKAFMPIGIVIMKYLEFRQERVGFGNDFGSFARQLLDGGGEFVRHPTKRLCCAFERE